MDLEIVKTKEENKKIIIDFVNKNSVVDMKMLDEKENQYSTRFERRKFSRLNSVITRISKNKIIAGGIMSCAFVIMMVVILVVINLTLNIRVSVFTSWILRNKLAKNVMIINYLNAAIISIISGIFIVNFKEILDSFIFKLKVISNAYK